VDHRRVFRHLAQVGQNAAAAGANWTRKYRQDVLNPAQQPVASSFQQPGNPHCVQQPRQRGRLPGTADHPLHCPAQQLARQSAGANSTTTIPIGNHTTVGMMSLSCQKKAGR
jgi:hypothetical protein